jgi:hypothetical protein
VKSDRKKTSRLRSNQDVLAGEQPLFGEPRNKETQDGASGTTFFGKCVISSG